ATNSISRLSLWAALKTFRPIRPNPLIPTRIDMQTASDSVRSAPWARGACRDYPVRSSLLHVGTSGHAPRGGRGLEPQPTPPCLRPPRPLGPAAPPGPPVEAPSRDADRSPRSAR